MVGALLLSGLLLSLPPEAEFPPYRPYRGPIKPGVVITRDNLPQYEAELKKLLPPSRWHWFFELGLKPGRITVPVQEVKLFPPKPGYRRWTERNRRSGRCRIGPNNQLIGWEAGTPFPEPKNALEVAWNCYPEVSHATSPEDCIFPGTYNFYDRHGRYEKHFTWTLYKKKYRGRTDIPPIPSMPEALSAGILSKESIVITEPFDVKGFVQLRFRYWDVAKDDDCYSYLPALRRLRRMTGADVCDPILGSDMPYDDYEAWRQKLNPRMTFEVVAIKDLLVPATYTKRPPGFHRGPCFQINWEIRPCFVLDIHTNDPNYMYSRRRLYVDATREGNWTIWWGEHYDQRGRIWRAIGVTPVAHLRGKTPELQRISGFRNLFGYVITTELTHHYSNPIGSPEFWPIDPDVYFSIRGLLRTAR